MFVRRFLLDFLTMAVALWCGTALLRGSLVARWGNGVLLIAGLLVTLLCSLGVEQGYRWMLVSGVAFAWGAAVCCAAMIRGVVGTSPGRRKFLHGAMAVPAATLGYGMFIGRRKFGLREVDVAMPGLPADLEGLRLVQLSDIHLSPFLSRGDLRYCVDMANETRVQIGFVTGDLITGIHDSIDECLEELKRLRADAGVFGCNGNHEMYIDAESYVVERAANMGMRVLRQAQASLTFGSSKLNIAGVDHQWDRKNYLRHAPGLLRAGETNLLLSHNPDVFPEAAKQGWDLTLAGHMHGGQLNLDVMGTDFNFARMATPYVYGLYREERSAIYVSRGIGTIGMPVRVGAAPEVALITLRRG
ncbi:MAG: metallophosphoesterase [Acidobacteriota bacterium]